MGKLVLIVLVIVVLIVLVRDPQGMGHLVGAIFEVGAKLLHGIAAFLDNLTH